MLPSLERHMEQNHASFSFNLSPLCRFAQLLPVIPRHGVDIYTLWHGFKKLGTWILLGLKEKVCRFLTHKLQHRSWGYIFCEKELFITWASFWHCRTPEVSQWCFIFHSQSSLVYHIIPDVLLLVQNSWLLSAGLPNRLSLGCPASFFFFAGALWNSTPH